MGKKNKKLVTKNEFSFNRKISHNTYVFCDDGRNYKAVGITHSHKTFGKKNMPLEDNPQKGKKEKAYVRNGIISDNHSHFDKPKKNFNFSKADFPKVKSKIRNYKKKTSGRRK